MDRYNSFLRFAGALPRLYFSALALRGDIYFDYPYGGVYFVRKYQIGTSHVGCVHLVINPQSAAAMQKRQNTGTVYMFEHNQAVLPVKYFPWRIILVRNLCPLRFESRYFPLYAFLIQYTAKKQGNISRPKESGKNYSGYKCST